MFLGVLGRATFSFAAAENAGKKNLHKEDIIAFQESCLTCHSSDPVKSKQWADTIDVEKCGARCSGCHDVPLSCTLISTEKSTRILKSQMQYLGLPLLSEVIYCGSCHVFHDKGQQGIADHRLNIFYPNFRDRAERVDLHRSGLFCKLCHDPEPVSSTADQKIKVKGDRVGVCTKCHDGKLARADNHPVRISPSAEKGVHIPESFPLSDGKVTCLTCHLMPCQGGKVEGNLLRGGPYEKRVDVCLTCHMKERYQAVNPHIQVDKDGHIMKNKCLYCHTI
jgi:hypothetical protein